MTQSAFKLNQLILFLFAHIFLEWFDSIACFSFFFLQFMRTSLLFMALHSYLTAYQTPLAIMLRKFYFAVLSKSTKWKHFHPNISNRNGLNFEFSLVEFVAFITHWWRKLKMMSKSIHATSKINLQVHTIFFWIHILLRTLSSIYQPSQGFFID